MNDLNPATFDVEGWLVDAALPEESATVYKRPDVVAELTDLKRRIGIETRAADAEQSAAAQTPRALEKEYEALLRTFSDSALTVYVRALTRDEMAELRAASEADTKDMEAVAANAEFGYRLTAAAIVAVKPAGGERTPVTFTAGHVKALEKAIGATQMQLILAAKQQAQNGLPTVDADFLRKPSGTDAGQG